MLGKARCQKQRRKWSELSQHLQKKGCKPAGSNSCVTAGKDVNCSLDEETVGAPEKVAQWSMSLLVFMLQIKTQKSFVNKSSFCFGSVHPLLFSISFKKAFHQFTLLPLSWWQTWHQNNNWQQHKIAFIVSCVIQLLLVRVHTCAFFAKKGNKLSTFCGVAWSAVTHSFLVSLCVWGGVHFGSCDSATKIRNSWAKSAKKEDF